MAQKETATGVTMKYTKFTTIIGIEVHVELKTKSKMFCGCNNHHFQVKPNTHTCPVCLGLPGALPVPNEKAIDWCLLLGLALNCKINNLSKFNRKNYFYPDLPKGYQISQYDSPFCVHGKLEIKDKMQKPRTIRINRVHMEEDTAKLVHAKVDDEEISLIDFNRSGVPLVEIVTEAEIHSSEETIFYLKKIQQIVRYLNISNADMEKGSMRCEINLSLSIDGKLPPFKIELKNINSFRFVKKAIDYEIKRQEKILRLGKIPVQETRGFDATRNKTFSQRTKEEAHDYRYFPEPDIPLIKVSQEKISSLEKILPELPDEKARRFAKEYKLSTYNANLLTFSKKRADYFEEAVKIGKANQVFPEIIANTIVNKRISIKKYLPQEFVKLLLKKQTQKINDQKLISKVITKAMKSNPKAVADFKKGKQVCVGFLLGQVMRETKGKADPLLTQKLLLEKLKS